MNKVYDVDYFIKKFEAIPRNKWITNNYGLQGTGVHCAYGHCGVSNSTSQTKESIELAAMFHVSGMPPVSTINDLRLSRFPQKTPKGRILAALRAIKKNNG